MLNIELQPNVQAVLTERAKRKGMEVEEYAACLLNAEIERIWKLREEPELPVEERIKLFNEWAENHKPNDKPLSDFAVSRDSMYE